MELTRHVEIMHDRMDEPHYREHLKFWVKGPAGAVQFYVWCQPHILPDGATPADYGVGGDGIMAIAEAWVKSRAGRTRKDDRLIDWDAYAVDLGYHSRQPRYPNEDPQSNECPYLDGVPCYYDGSGLNADRVLYQLVPYAGWEGIWAELEEFYVETFGAAQP